MNHIKTSLLSLALISASLMAMDQEAPHRANPCTKLKAAFVVGLALFAGKSILDYQTTPEIALDSSGTITVGGNIKTTIIDSDSGLVIPDVNAAIESYKAKHGYAECDVVPYKLKGDSQTLKLKCRTLTMEEYYDRPL